MRRLSSLNTKMGMAPLGTLHEEKRGHRRKDAISQGKRAEWRSQTTVHRIVHSPCFDGLCVVLAMASTAFYGYRANYLAMQRRHQVPSHISAMQTFLTLAIVIEVSLRAITLGRDFFADKDERIWNVLDVMIAIIQVFDQIVEHAQLKGSSTILTTTIRMMRFLRLLRIVKIVHVFREKRSFRQLRVMVDSIFSSVSFFLWAMLFIFSSLYVMAVFLTEAVTEYVITAPLGDQLSQDIEELFGDLGVSIYHLLQAITGGTNWGNLAKPLMQLGLGYGIAFCTFICFTLVVVLNIVTSIAVQLALDITERSKDLRIQRELEIMDGVRAELAAAFDELDENGDETLDAREFRQLLKDRRVVAWLKTIGLHMDKADSSEDELLLFRLLGGGNEYITCDQFVEGCMRYRNPTKQFDMKRMLYENQEMTQRLEELMHDLLDKMQILDKMQS